MKAALMIAIGFALGIAAAIALTAFLDTSSVTIAQQRNELQDLRRQSDAAGKYRRSVNEVKEQAEQAIEDLKSGKYRNREIEDLIAQNAIWRRRTSTWRKHEIY